jgi:ABC-type Fe3+/spermidine/putrescine transport system ATPase subunit
MSEAQADPAGPPVTVFCWMTCHRPLGRATREDMRTLLQALLADLDIPAIHVTHDRAEALIIGGDLAVIVDGQLRQTRPARQVAAEPADPDTARLLGWAELGPGTATNAAVRAGQRE